MQRQRLPEIAQRISSSLGSGFSASSATDVSIIPGVQKPHCRPCSSLKPSWIGCSAPPWTQALDRRDRAAVAWTANMVQDLTGTPSTQHGAGAAARRVAADVRAGQAERLAQEVHEQEPRLDVGRALLAVDGDLDGWRRGASMRPSVISLLRRPGPRRRPSADRAR